MSAYAAPIEVAQAALHRCGEETITSLDEGSACALVTSSNYEGIVRANLTRHAWDFSTETVTLALEGATTQGPYLWSWIIPAEAINVRWVERPGGCKLRRGDYRVRGKKILTVESFAGGAPQAVVTVRAQEGSWPDDFAEAIVTRLEGLYIQAIQEKPQDARLKIKDAEAMFRAAIVRDRRQSPGIAPEYNRLAEHWRGLTARR